MRPSDQTPEAVRRRPPPSGAQWTVPALGGVVALAGFLYAWDAAGNLEIYYAAAVRSMSTSWHDFFFAAVDPAGSVSLDKLPGAFWVQAVFVRVFGVHAWALVAPQVIEGMASVAVLYRAVGRVTDPVTGLVASVILLLSPAAVALDRGNISDTLMILLLLLAANSTVTSILSGRFRHLILAGVWVGLAFQAKMVEAWLVLPAIGLAYLVAGRGPIVGRLTRMTAAGAVTAVVSLSWMVAVSLWPASSRPYVDGSAHNSVFSQVFVYNGFGRLDQPSPNQLLTKAIGLQLGSAPAGWNRLLTGAYGRDTGWLLPAAVLALLVGLITDPDKGSARYGGTVMWSSWLVVLTIVFSASSSINSYYTAALAPPVAALLATAGCRAWAEGTRPAMRGLVALTVLGSAAYAAWLLPRHGVGTVAGLAVTVSVVAVIAAVGAVIGLPRQGKVGTAALVTVGVALVLTPAAASASVVANRLGPFDTPFESGAAFAPARALGGLAQTTQSLLPTLEGARRGAPYLMATQTAAVASPFIYDSGQEVLPIGGYSGSIPSPTLARIEQLIRAGDFHLVIQAPDVTDPRLQWIAQHCLQLSSGRKASGAAAGGLRFAVYYCTRAA